jgi:hypothetical protein
MAVARSSEVFLGTDDSTGVTITNNSTSSGSELDLLDDNTSAGEIELFIKFTSTVTAGNIRVKVRKRRATGEAYDTVASGWTRSFPPVNATARYSLGRFPVSRYMAVDVFNDATGASLTNVFVSGELFKFS